MTFQRSFGTNNPLTFEVLQAPKPGSVLVLHSFFKQVKLLHLAAPQRHGWPITRIPARGARPCLLPLN